MSETVTVADLEAAFQEHEAWSAGAIDLVWLVLGFVLVMFMQS